VDFAMVCPGSAPTFSISIEWENARFAELERTRRMLRALREQLLALAPRTQLPQINILYDRGCIDGEIVRRVVAEELQPESLPAATAILPNDGLRYYQQKNLGGRLGEVDLAILLDCDVVPEPGWLQAMLDAFDDPKVGVVAGETYIEYKTFYSKAFALFWFFPLRDPSTDLQATTFFHANNVAFRSEIFAAWPFPDLPTYRGQCTVLGHTLREKGVGIYVQKRARVSHPVPLSIKYFIGRALNNGRDEVLVDAIVHRRNRRQLRSVYWNYRTGLVGSFRKFRAHAPDVGLSLPASVAAYLVGAAYFTLKAIGELVTHVRPNLVSRLFPV
jgi:hypothetical protein